MATAKETTQVKGRELLKRLCTSINVCTNRRRKHAELKAKANIEIVLKHINDQCTMNIFPFTQNEGIVSGYR